MLILTTDKGGNEIIFGSHKDDKVEDAYALKERDDRNRLVYVIHMVDGSEIRVNQTGWNQLKKACGNCENS